MVALFGKKEKELSMDPAEHAIGRVATPHDVGGEPGFTREGTPVVTEKPQIPDQAVPQETVVEVAPSIDQNVENNEPLPAPTGQSVIASDDQPVSMATAAIKSAARKQVEEILSEGLTQVYQGMTPQEQLEFRKKGEEAATKIEALMTGFKASAKKIVDIIRTWLATIPRVNRYFLEQEWLLRLLFGL